MSTSSLVAAAVFSIALSGQSFESAQFRSGTIPASPITAVGGGQVMVELSVDQEGRVTSVTPLRTTPGFTDAVVRAVSDWQFAPAEDENPRGAASNNGRPTRTRVDSKVLVVAVYLAPVFLGPTLGEGPRDIQEASAEAAFPLSTIPPAYPPQSLGSGVVLIEARVDGDGVVGDVKVLRSVPPFDDVARATIRRWTFRPARLGRAAVSTRVYVILGFRVPIGIA